MATAFDFPQWSLNKSGKGKPLVLTMENSSWSVDELERSTLEFAADKDRLKNTKQLSWVLLLRAHRAAGCLAWLAHGIWALLSAVKKRLILRQGVVITPEKQLNKNMYRFLRGILSVAVILMCVEGVAHVRGWHFTTSESVFRSIYLAWVLFRASYIAPPLQFLADFCIALFLVQSADRIILFLGCVWIKYKKIKPQARIELLGSDDLEQPGNGYPNVLIQIPMCNEIEVYEQSIAAACQLDWPRDRMLIQVLDDSSNIEIQSLIRAEAQKWHRKGINIDYKHRTIRTGYKAGNLNSGMSCDYVKDHEFVAIFDADFQPKADFLKRTVPFFKEDPDLALVQARWSFVNKDENLLTRLQNINLCYHFEVEQQVNGYFLNFFGFNGTAGVWRIKALEDAGGWLERTTVEDMDIAVRAHLLGWKFIFLNDVECLCELPESYEAYKKQQHRWHSGPMQLFRLCFMDIIYSKIPWWKKSNLILLFFLLRKLILPFYSFTLFCIILPTTIFVPEAQLPVWVICYIPATMSLLNILPSPKSFPFIVPFLIFENTMSVTKFNAMISGLCQLGSAYEWVVTKKSGRASESDLLAFSEKEPSKPAQLLRGVSDSGIDVLSKCQEQPKLVKKKKNRLYRKELSLAFLLLIAAARSLLSNQGVHFYFLLFQGISFLVIGLDLIGEQVS